MSFSAIPQFLEKSVYNAGDMAGRPPTTPPTDNGARLAAQRKAAGLSQVQFAEALGIPKRTVTFYERKAQNLPSSILPKMAEVLGVTIEDLIGIEGKSSKRGPKSKLERQFDKVRTLPKSEQDFAVDMLDRIINSSGQAS